MPYLKKKKKIAGLTVIMLHCFQSRKFFATLSQINDILKSVKKCLDVGGMKYETGGNITFRSFTIYTPP
jgi:hypothetical protein